MRVSIAITTNVVTGRADCRDHWWCTPRCPTPRSISGLVRCRSSAAPYSAGQAMASPGVAIRGRQSVATASGGRGRETGRLVLRPVWGYRWPSRLVVGSPEPPKVAPPTGDMPGGPSWRVNWLRRYCGHRGGQGGRSSIGHARLGGGNCRGVADAIGCSHDAHGLSFMAAGTDNRRRPPRAMTDSRGE